jgi:hypothetical protein
MSFFSHKILIFIDVLADDIQAISFFGELVDNGACCCSALSSL